MIDPSDEAILATDPNRSIYTNVSLDLGYLASYRAWTLAGMTHEQAIAGARLGTMPEDAP